MADDRHIGNRKLAITPQPIATKFCMNTQVVTTNRARGENLHILKSKMKPKENYLNSLEKNCKYKCKKLQFYNSA